MKILKHNLVTNLPGTARSKIVPMNIDKIKATPLDKVLVLDTETTGFDKNAEILQFSALWGTGQLAMNWYIRPVRHTSWPSAMEVNHITPAMIAHCAPMTALRPQIEAILTRASVIVGYNLPFDLRMLKQNSITLPDTNQIEYVDLMIPFAKVYGVWNDTYQNYKWQKLITCARYYGYQGDGWHDSLADTKATLHCYLEMLRRGHLEDV